MIGRLRGQYLVLCFGILVMFILVTILILRNTHIPRAAHSNSFEAHLVDGGERARADKSKESITGKATTCGHCSETIIPDFLKRATPRGIRTTGATTSWFANYCLEMRRVLLAKVRASEAYQIAIKSLTSSGEQELPRRSAIFLLATLAAEGSNDALRALVQAASSHDTSESGFATRLLGNFANNINVRDFLYASARAGSSAAMESLLAFYDDPLVDQALGEFSRCDAPEEMDLRRAMVQTFQERLTILRSDNMVEGVRKLLDSSDDRQFALQLLRTRRIASAEVVLTQHIESRVAQICIPGSREDASAVGKKLLNLITSAPDSFGDLVEAMYTKYQLVSDQISAVEKFVLNELGLIGDPADHLARLFVDDE